MIKFNACKHLDFSDKYNAKKEPIRLGGKTKVVWSRPVPYEGAPSLVQFCKLRGRLNYPHACHCESQKMCSDYEDFKHKVQLKSF